MNDDDFPPIALGSLFAGSTLRDAIGLAGGTWLDETERRARLERSFELPAVFRSVSDLRSKYLGQTVALVGGGRSLANTLDELRAVVAAGAKVAAVNKSHDYLIAHGIIPDFGIMADPKPRVRDYQTPITGTRYLLSSQCDMSVFDRFSAHGAASLAQNGESDVFIWHSLGADGDADFLVELATKHQRAIFSVVGGQTTTMRADDILAYMGFRTVHLFGVDSSGEPDKLHPYPKDLIEPVDIDAWLMDPIDGREFVRSYKTSRGMAQQAIQWELILQKRHEAMLAGEFPHIHHVVHGDGLFPDWAALRGLHADPARAAAIRADGYRPHVVLPPIDLGS